MGCPPSAHFSSNASTCAQMAGPIDLGTLATEPSRFKAHRLAGSQTDPFASSENRHWIERRSCTFSDSQRRSREQKFVPIQPPRLLERSLEIETVKMLAPALLGSTQRRRDSRQTLTPSRAPSFPGPRGLPDGSPFRAPAPLDYRFQFRLT
jgi:hypothetical protein